jgi:hypothetical protein
MPLLKDYPLGTRVIVYCSDAAYKYLNEQVRTAYTISATIVGTCGQTVCLGWKKGEPRPVCENWMFADHAPPGGETMLDNVKADYECGWWVRNITVVFVSGTQAASQSSLIQAPTCTKCNANYPDGEHDPSKGAFVCCSCKLWGRLA